MAEFTECGLKGIGRIPYGAHMCHFYGDRENLLAAAVPYLDAGLRAGERCIWVSGEPLDAAAAREELRKAGCDVVAETARGALAVWGPEEWYLKQGRLDADGVCRLWLEEESRARAGGYAGLRVTGNVSFLSAETWPDFMQYERAVDAAFRGRRIVALCSYAKGSCGLSEVFDVVRHHNCALDHPDEGWQVLSRPPEVALSLR